MKNLFKRNQPGASVIIDTVKKNKFLGFTILWFAILMTIFAIASYLAHPMYRAIESLKNVEISIGVYIGISVLTVVLLLVLGIWGYRMNFYVQLIIAFMTSAGLGLTTGVVILNFASYSSLTSMLLILITPILMMFIFALLATLNLIKEKILWFVAIGALLSMLIVGIISIFTFNKRIYILYTILGTLFAFAYLGIDMVIIIKTNKQFNGSISSKETTKELLKFSLYFGFRLFYDWLYLVLYLSSLFRK